MTMICFSLVRIRNESCTQKVEQALAVRVLDRLVAGADEDAFESNNAAATGDQDAGYRRTSSRQAPRGGSNNLTPAGAADTTRRRSSETPALSVSRAYRNMTVHICLIWMYLHCLTNLRRDCFLDLMT